MSSNTSKLAVEKYSLTTLTHGTPLSAPMNKYTRASDAEKEGGPEGRVILLLGHGAGFSKETWEPVIEDLFDLDDGKSGKHVVREAWGLDCQNHGEGCTLNENLLSKNQALLTIWDYADAFATLVKSGILGVIDPAKHQIVLCGHSAGAVGVTLSTCFFNPPSRLPFSSVILVDPPLCSKVMASEDSEMYKIVEATTPVRVDIWDSREAAAKWFKKRIPWAMWDERVLDAYLTHGLRSLPTAYYPEHSSGVTLTTHRLAENAAFTGKKFSLDAIDRLNQICKHTPVHLIYGDRNDMFEREFQDSLISEQDGRVFASITRLEDIGHLVVQEAPTLLAETLFSILSKSGTSTAPASKL